MNIKDFLIDNYIWILVIILITIITIIGFIADKNKSKPKKEKIIKEQVNNDGKSPIQANNVANQTLNDNIQLPNQNENALGMNLNNMDTSINPVGTINDLNSQSKPIDNINNAINSITEEPQMNSNMNMQSMSNPIPVENVIPQAMPESMHQPLQEQSVISNTQPVTNFDNVIAQTMPTPALPVENQFNSNIPNNNQPMMQQNFGTHLNQNMNMQSNFRNPIQQQQPLNTQPNQMFNQIPNNNNLNQMGQQMGNNNINNMPAFNQNNTTIPTPVNPISAPKPVIPQPIMQGTNNHQPMMQQNFGNQMGQQGMNQQSNMPTQQPTQNTLPSNGAPVSFVFGPQNNNQNM